MGARGRAGLLQAFGLILAFRQVAFNWSVFMTARGKTRPMAVNGVLALITFFAVTVPLMYRDRPRRLRGGMAVVLVVELCVRVFYLRRLFSGFRIIRHFVRAIAPSVPAVAVILGLRAALDLDRTAGLALAELALYIVVTIAATILFERRLLAEMVGYVRGGTRQPAPAT